MSETIPFKDQREALFGRAHALDTLRRRAGHTGLTSLVGSTTVWQELVVTRACTHPFGGPRTISWLSGI